MIEWHWLLHAVRGYFLHWQTHQIVAADNLSACELYRRTLSVLDFFSMALVKARCPMFNKLSFKSGI